MPKPSLHGCIHGTLFKRVRKVFMMDSIRFDQQNRGIRLNVLLRCCLLALCSSVFLLACQPDPEGNKPRPGGRDRQRAAESAAQDHLPFEVLDIYEGRYEQGPALVVAWSRPVDPRQNWNG